MGDFQRALYDYSVAIKMATQYDEDSKTLAEYYSMAGVQHYELGQLDEALKHYNLAIEKCPDKEDSIGLFYYNRGLVNSRLDKIKEAIDDYTKAEEKISEQDHLY